MALVHVCFSACAEGDRDGDGLRLELRARFEAMRESALDVVAMPGVSAVIGVCDVAGEWAVQQVKSVMPSAIIGSAH